MCPDVVHVLTPFATLIATSGKRNVMVWHPSVCLSVCPVGILIVTHQGTACDAAISARQ